MKLSERMKEILDSTQDLTVWVASWIDEVAQLEALLLQTANAAERDMKKVWRRINTLEAENKELKEWIGAICNMSSADEMWAYAHLHEPSEVSE